MGFREYFEDQAAVADDLCERGFVLNACITATAAIDALAEIWGRDFPIEASALSREFGGSVPGAARMSRFVATLFSKDPRTAHVSVLRFAEDASRFAPGLATAEVTALLAARRVGPNEMPSESLDCDMAALTLEAPLLMSNANVRRLAVEYQYPGLLYSLYRCPMVHTFGCSKQTHGFAKIDEVSYMSLQPGFTSVGFGPCLMTNWLRGALAGYVDKCAAAKIKPAACMDPGHDQENRLQSRWSRA